MIHAILLDNYTPFARPPFVFQPNRIPRSDFEQEFFFVLIFVAFLAIAKFPFPVASTIRLPIYIYIYIFHPLKVKETRGNDLISRRGTRRPVEEGSEGSLSRTPFDLPWLWVEQLLPTIVCRNFASIVRDLHAETLHPSPRSN